MGFIGQIRHGRRTLRCKQEAVVRKWTLKVGEHEDADDRPELPKLNGGIRYFPSTLERTYTHRVSFTAPVRLCNSSFHRKTK